MAGLNRDGHELMADDDSVDTSPRRLCPERPLPPYSYVPGRSPHPRSNPRGHAYGEAEPSADGTDLADWQTCELHRFAVDLFEAGCYWEAHECWEALWIAAGRHGPVADLLKGLIKLAAAGVKAREGNAAGCRRHARRAAELFRATDPQEAAAAGTIDPVRLAHEAARAADGMGLRPHADADRPRAVVFDFHLLPAHP